MMLELSPLETAAKASALLDAGLGQGVAVEADAVDRLPGEVLTEPGEGGRVLIDDRDRVVAPGQAARQRRADPAAAQDDDVHGSPLSSMQLTMCDAVTTGVTACVADCLPRRSWHSPWSRTRSIPRRGRHDQRAQTRRGRPARPQRPPRRHAAAQEDRAAGLRQRRPVLGRRTRPRRSCSSSPSAACRSSTSRRGSRVGVVMLMLVVVACYRQNVHAYPERRRRLRGRHHEPRRQVRADRRERADRRLRADRRGLGLGRGGELPLGGAVAGLAPGAAGGARRRGHHAAEPARRPRVRHRLRDPDLRVPGRRDAHDRLRA